LSGFARRSPAFFGGIRKAAMGRRVAILALSGGGSNGAFGAGALVGLTRSGARPQFDLVTGVSAGALIAPFAFLGPSWDAQLEQAFTGRDGHLPSISPFWGILSRLLFPLGVGLHDALHDLVDHFVTPVMIDAVARETTKGRRLVVATTDLDTRETVLWNMGVIAQRGGEKARRLFRDVLVASASVPGIFPPVLIQVREGGQRYDEMHVDGGITTAVFTFPLIASIRPQDLPRLRGTDLYMIINGQLATLPRTTPVNTVDVLANSFDAILTYGTREAVVRMVELTHRLQMQFRMTEIPVDYPALSFTDFRPQYMREVFAYGETCAARGELWISPEQSLRRNMHPLPPGESGAPRCPAATGTVVKAGAEAAMRVAGGRGEFRLAERNKRNLKRTGLTP
jgi:hypothetical protein